MKEAKRNMDLYKCTIVDLAYYEREKQIVVNVDIQGDNIEMSCEVDGVCFSAAGEYYFETFQLFRNRLLEFGKQALNKDIFSIWDYADIKEFPSTDEQKLFANKWYKSLEKN